MGNTCGQYCGNNENGDPSELLTVDNKVSGFNAKSKSHSLSIVWKVEYLYGSNGKYKMSQIKESVLTAVYSLSQNKFIHHMHHVVRLQAWFRGANIRRRMANHFGQANLHMEYMSGSKRVMDAVNL